MVRACVWAGWVVLCSALAPQTTALAEVVEPNGVSVPLNSNNGETQLSELFTMRGESIDFVVDGSATPSTFSPLCGFSATFVLKQSGSTLGVGWYNADPALATAPTSTEVHEIVPAGSPVGTVVTGADIRSDPAYLGGSIGFALLRAPNPDYFTEARYNPVCSLCSTPGPWVLSVSYASGLSTSAFYVAFEDGNADAFTWSNDGDFNDYVFYFEGLSCVGEGEACEVEAARGVCIPGVLECDIGGALVCKSALEPDDEVCDALDNDCDGESDEGDDLCAVGEVCSRGQCVPRCGDVEFLCVAPPFTLCEQGVCVEPECAGKTCDEGQACVAGECRAPCDDVVCPGDDVCRLGACVDPCDGIVCGDERVCSGGACVLRCDCAGCPQGLACDPGSGACVDEGCETQTCTAGEVCSGGACVDACQGARCPNGAQCAGGKCALATGGADGGAGSSGGSGTGGTGGTGGADAAPSSDVVDAGTDRDAGERLPPGAGLPTRRPEGTEAGCSCRVGGPRRAAHAWRGAFALALSIALVLRRRRRRARRG